MEPRALLRDVWWRYNFSYSLYLQGKNAEKNMNSKIWYDQSKRAKQFKWLKGSDNNFGKYKMYDIRLI